MFCDFLVLKWLDFNKLLIVKCQGVAQSLLIDPNLTLHLLRVLVGHKKWTVFSLSNSTRLHNLLISLPGECISLLGHLSLITCYFINWMAVGCRWTRWFHLVFSDHCQVRRRFDIQKWMAVPDYWRRLPYTLVCACLSSLPLCPLLIEWQECKSDINVR